MSRKSRASDKRASLALGHRVHHYKSLMRRWRKVAAESGLKLCKLSPTAEPEVYYVKSPSLAETGGVYLSTGIHGDEPAGPEALVTWAEKNAKRLARMPCILLPCLNPWGLINNSRIDQGGRDLNRTFHTDDVPAIQMLKALVKSYRFALSLTLHEDYDAQGLYMYEISHAKPTWGDELLDAARPFVPRDPRPMIEGRRAKMGLVRRRIVDKTKFPLVPEALYLHWNKCERSITIETPSEFDIGLRVGAHIAVIEKCLELLRL